MSKGTRITKRWIDADGIMRACYDSFLKTNNKAYAEIVALVNAVPAADVAEVRHGRWEGGEDAGKYCSVCHQRTLSAAFMNATLDGIEYRQVITPFCMWCGAKMDEEENK